MKSHVKAQLRPNQRSDLDRLNSLIDLIAELIAQEKLDEIKNQKGGIGNDCQPAVQN